MGSDARRVALALALLVAGACGSASPAAPGPTGNSAVTQTPGARGDVPFADVVHTQMSGLDDDARLIVATDRAARAELAGHVRYADQPGRVAIGAFQGSQRTGGHNITVERIERDGATITVHASFVAPPPDAMVIQVLTSPAHVVSVREEHLQGVTTAVLVDRTGRERHRTAVAPAGQ